MYCKVFAKSTNGLGRFSFSDKLTIGDPQRVAAMLPSWRNRANPKSAIFSVMLTGAGSVLPQLCDRRMFWGFKSRCTIPFAKSAFIAPAKSNNNERSRLLKNLMQSTYPVGRETT